MSWWKVYRRSDNVEDRTRKVAVPVVVAAVGVTVGWCGGHQVATVTDPVKEAGTFIEHVLGDNEDVWRGLLGAKYRPPHFVVFSKVTAKGCGRDAAKAAFGPFYCELNQTIFLDQSFFIEIKTRSCKQMGEACEFSRAQIISHEHGHHVQNLLGTLEEANNDPSPLSGVKIELQADCFSGIWAGRSNQKWRNVNPAMLTAALEVTRLFGDDPRGGPKSHGTPEQRADWFMRGYSGKEMTSCDIKGVR